MRFKHDHMCVWEFCAMCARACSAREIDGADERIYGIRRLVTLLALNHLKLDQFVKYHFHCSRRRGLQCCAIVVYQLVYSDQPCKFHNQSATYATCDTCSLWCYRDWASNRSLQNGCTTIKRATANNWMFAATRVCMLSAGASAFVFVRYLIEFVYCTLLTWTNIQISRLIRLFVGVYFRWLMLCADLLSAHLIACIRLAAAYRVVLFRNLISNQCVCACTWAWHLVLVSVIYWAW